MRYVQFDYFNVSKTKLNNNLTSARFMLSDYNVKVRRDMDRNGGGLYVSREMSIWLGGGLYVSCEVSVWLGGGLYVSREVSIWLRRGAICKRLKHLETVLSEPICSDLAIAKKTWFYSNLSTYFSYFSK